MSTEIFPSIPLRPRWFREPDSLPSAHLLTYAHLHHHQGIQPSCSRDHTGNNKTHKGWQLGRAGAWIGLSWGEREEPLQQQSWWQPGHPDVCQLSKVGRKGSSLGWLPGMRSAGGSAWSQPVFSMRDQGHTQEVRFRKDLASSRGHLSHYLSPVLSQNVLKP